MTNNEIIERLAALALPAGRFLRLDTVLQLISVSKKEWLEGVKSGQFPPPVEFGEGGMQLWKVEDIRRLVEAYEHPSIKKEEEQNEKK